MKGKWWDLGKDPRVWKLGVVVIVIAVMCCAGKGHAFETLVGEKPFSIMGYIDQGVAYGISGDQYDTKKEFQTFITQALIEVKYEPSPDVGIFVSGKGNVDWAYGVYAGKNEWKDKQFDESRSGRFVLDDWQDILSEAHVTWKPGKFYFRAGKQIVAWGETDGFRLMDQINPADTRRGMGDVEFESSILPIWLIRSEYRVPVQSSWLQDLNLQFIFNPNLKFRGNVGIAPGNDVAGIWAPKVDIGLGGPYPFDYAHLGSFDQKIDKPGDFSKEGFEYAGRIAATIHDARITLNGFYGRDNDPAMRGLPLPPRIEISRYDGRMIIHPAMEGYYPLFKFVGATFSRDISPLRASCLGGVSPVLRIETFYAFNSTFATGRNTLEKFDEFRWAAGVDWKVRVPILNEKSFFTIMPQVYNRRVMDYPGNYELSGVRENNWMTTLIVNTSYLHNKLTPMVFWMRDWSNRGDMYKFQLTYEPSQKWKYTLGALFVGGDKEGKGFEPLDHKDNLYFTASYKF